MPRYRCPKCGREVEKPPGTYYCKYCGPTALMGEVEPFKRRGYVEVLPTRTQLGFKSEKIPYGRESMVGARTEFLTELLPDWEWDPLTRTLTSPNRKIKIHAHFTEISGDLAPYREEIMKAIKDIREKAFLRIPVGYFVEETALPMFKELAKPYADVLNKYGS